MRCPTEPLQAQVAVQVTPTTSPEKAGSLNLRAIPWKSASRRKNAWTTKGSNWVPDPFRMMLRATLCVIPCEEFSHNPWDNYRCSA